MTRATLERDNGTVETQNGTCGFIMVASPSQEVGMLSVQFAFDIGNPKDLIAMLGTLFTTLDETFGEGFVTACISHYVVETEKPLMEAGDHHIAMLRGERRAPPPGTKKKRGKR